MKPSVIPFQSVDWSEVPKTVHPGEKGLATWQTIKFEDLCLRIVEYSARYLADHWCRFVAYSAIRAEYTLQHRQTIVKTCNGLRIARKFRFLK
jgi:hypothetical protein